MATRQNVTTPDADNVQRIERDSELALRPPVDVLEDSSGITLTRDMPGVAKDHLGVQTQHNVLVVDGEMHINMPEGMKALYADVQATRYRRSFTPSSELEADKADTDLKDGVLTIRIPNRAELHPRRIEVRGISSRTIAAHRRPHQARLMPSRCYPSRERSSVVASGGAFRRGDPRRTRCFDVGFAPLLLRTRGDGNALTHLRA